MFAWCESGFSSTFLQLGGHGLIVRDGFLTLHFKVGQASHEFLVEGGLGGYINGGELRFQRLQNLSLSWSYHS